MTSTQPHRVKALLLAFGSNMPGVWGSSRATLSRACRELANRGVRIVRCSSLYATRPVGGGRQPHYLNAVALAESSLAPAQLLRLLKQLERSAGRKLRPRMRARPLDIDILDFGGRRVGRPAATRRPGQLVLPHPEMQGRAFVLRPLLDVAPHWHHPGSRRSARALLERIGGAVRAGVHQALDFTANPCEEETNLRPLLRTHGSGAVLRV